jgi:arylsulfatase A-like enzyme
VRHLAWLVGLLVAATLPGAAISASRPNIVLIIAEDLGLRIGAYGDGVAQTPNVDRLAREGTRFTRAFTTAGVCAPSRAAILMGVHQNAWGAGHMRVGAGGYAATPPPHWKGFPELLRAAGYYTVTNGKTDYQLGVGLSGIFGGPFTIWDDDDASDWRGRDEGQPFFAQLTLENTHESNVWPTWDIASLTRLAMAPMRVAHHWAWEHRTDPASVVVPPYYPDTPTVRADIARHYDNVAAMDSIVGEILGKLAEDEVGDETIVIFTTDHGDGLPRAKRWTYDSGIHVPLIVRAADRAAAGTVDGSLVSGVDLAPTILSLAGVDVPTHMQGRIFIGPDRQPEPAYVFAARDRMDEQPDTVRAVRDRRFKYVRNLHPERPYVLDIAFRDQMPMMREMKALAESGDLTGPAALWFRPVRAREELYDTDADPHEIHDLAGDPAHAERLARMRSALDGWLEASGDLGLLPEAELRERMWPAGEEPTTADPTLRVDGRGRLVASCPTEGASIGVRVEGGAWRLYTGPLALASGTRVVVGAQRYGFARSGEVSLRMP